MWTLAPGGGAWDTSGDVARARRLIDALIGPSKLRSMPHFRRTDTPLAKPLFLRSRSPLHRLLTASASAAIWLLIGACERPRSAPPVDSSVPLRPAPVGSSGTPSGSSWDARLGPVLLVSASAPDLATVVVGDSSRVGADTVTEREAIALRSTPALLLGRADSVQLGILEEARVNKGDDETECTGWPTWRITSARSGAQLAAWSIGFVGATVQPLRMDSIENLSRADSARLAAEVTRLASSLPSTGAERFVGLPFTVTSLWRFRAGPNVEGVVANLVRHVNEEARPSEERTLVIAERDSSHRDERFTLGYYDRSQGSEETVESRDILALARPTAEAQPMLVIGRDYGDGMAYAIIQRDPSGRWREKWRSPRGHCKDLLDARERGRR